MFVYNINILNNYYLGKLYKKKKNGEFKKRYFTLYSDHLVYTVEKEKIKKKMQE